jgi:small-conductance mechanosensitive channel
MYDQRFINQSAPALANVVLPSIESPVQSVFLQLTETIQKQAEEVARLTKVLDEAEKCNADLQKEIWGLEEALDDLEQYGRRNSLRFHNCPVSNQQHGIDTDAIVMDLCKSKMNIDLTDEDISRSHQIGKPNKSGNIQIICKFKNWKIKNKVYTEKKKMKNTSIFVTEDLTNYRQEIIHELSKAKRAEKLHSFWTNDGRIFVKWRDRGPKQLIHSFWDLDCIA